tara:strand:+ start:680 stop:1246 length:567 start_codon:yes stop_codon:yes gene_type:complete
MRTLSIIVGLFSYVSAFNSVKPKTNFKFAGDTKPLGYFDPLQITKNSGEDTIKYLREAELQHSRTAMVASLVFPFIEIATKEPAINVLSEKSQAAQFAWLAFFSIYEVGRMNAGWNNPFNGGKPFTLKDTYEPGAVFLRSEATFFDNEDSEKRLNTELNNGRLAMLGIAGTMLQELVTKDELYLNIFN